MRMYTRAFVLVLGAITTLTTPSRAQHDDIEIWSTESRSGQLTTNLVSGTKVPVFRNLCAAGRCLYTNTDPGFVSTSTDTGQRYALPSGTSVRIEIVAIDSAVTLRIGDTRLSQPGDSAALGNAPIHLHPSWQVLLPENEEGSFDLSFRLTAAGYLASPVYSLTLTNEQATPTPSPTATSAPSELPTATSTETATISIPTPTATGSTGACTGDCSADGFVTVDEIVTGINVALGALATEDCPAFDAGNDGVVTVDEIVSAIFNALNGCP